MAVEPRPRILIITRNLPPLVGGMERLNWHMAEELAKTADVRIVGPAGSAGLAPAGILVREAPLDPLWKFLLRARTLARREAQAWTPDLVLAGSGLTAPLAHSAARLCGAKTAVYVHGLDVAVKHPAYRAIWLPALRRMDRVIANSRATAAMCREAGIPPDQIGIVHPGVDLPLAPLSPPERRREAPSTQRWGEGTGSRNAVLAAEPLSLRERGRGEGTDFRKRHNLGNRPLLLSVGRLSARKGLREFVANALPEIAAAHSDVILLIVGDSPNQALHAETQTRESIQAAADAAGVGEHLQFLGTITDYGELGAIYRAADVHVFPVRDIPGDPEGFGMVAVEAAAHGLPTAAFATGGVVDAVSENQSGYLVPPDDYQGLALAVLRILADQVALRPGCTRFAQHFAWPQFGQHVLAELALVVPMVDVKRPGA